MSFNLGTAWLQISPSIKNIQKDVAKAFGGVEAEARRVGESAGRSMTSGLTSKLVGLGALAATAIGIKNVAKEAATASDATQKFKATLDFAGLDGGQIEKLSKSTRKYADETVYDLNDIQSMTAQLAANSVKDFDKIAEATGNLNAIAGGNKETYRLLGLAITQTAGAGKLTTENWNQIANAIPGASGKLQEAMRKNGAFTGDFREAMAKSQITAEEFNQALLQLGMDDAAQKAAKSTSTLEGAWGNLQATIVGGFSDFISKIKPALTTAMEWVSDILGKFFSWFADAFNGIYDLVVNGDFTGAFARAFNVDEDSAIVDWLFRIRDGIIGIYDFIVKGDFSGAFARAFNVDEDSKIVDWLFRIRDGIMGIFDLIVNGNVNEHLKNAFNIDENNGFVRVIQDVRQKIIDFVRDIPSMLKGVFEWVIQNKGWLEPLAWGVLAAVGAFKALTTAIGIWQGITKIATAVQVAFNAVMSVNPIVAVGVAIAAITGALVYFFTQTELGRKIWGYFSEYLSLLWDGLRTAWDYLWTAVKAVYYAVIAPVVNAITTAFKIAWSIISGIFSAIVRVIKGDVSGAFTALKDTVKRVWDAIWGFIKNSWNNIVNLLKTVGKFLWDTFTWPFVQAAKLVGKAWDKIKSWFAAPINWVIEHVINGGIISFINAIVGALGLDSLKIKKVQPIGKPSEDKSIDAYAKGGYAKRGWALVGEQGPELVNFTHPGRVYTAEQTAEALSMPGREISPYLRPERMYTSDEALLATQAIKTEDPKLLQMALGDSPADSLLPIGGFFGSFGRWVKSAWDGVTDFVVNIGEKAVKFVRGRLADGAKLVIRPLQSLIRNSIGGVFGDFFVKSGDKLIDWIAGVDKGTEEISITDPIAAGIAAGLNGGKGLGGSFGPVGNIPAGGGVARPVAGGRLTSPFGVSRYGGMHSGIDLAAPMGTPVYAYRDGVVTRAGWNSLAGRTGIGIVLAHAGGMGSYYGHLSQALVHAGQTVKAGQNIGRVGSTGNSTGPHLHWEISLGGNPQRVVNPLPYLKYDDGGFLQPGVTQVVNATGRPEPVFTESQWNTLRAQAEGRAERKSPEDDGPKRVYLVVEDREFEAYIDERAEGALVGAARDLRGRR